MHLLIYCLSSALIFYLCLVAISPSMILKSSNCCFFLLLHLFIIRYYFFLFGHVSTRCAWWAPIITIISFEFYYMLIASFGCDIIFFELCIAFLFGYFFKTFSLFLTIFLYLRNKLNAEDQFWVLSLVKKLFQTHKK